MAWEHEDHGTSDIDVLRILCRRNLCGQPTDQELDQQEGVLKNQIRDLDVEILLRLKQKSVLDRELEIIHQVKRLDPDYLKKPDDDSQYAPIWKKT